MYISAEKLYLWRVLGEPDLHMFEESPRGDRVFIIHESDALPSYWIYTYT